MANIFVGSDIEGELTGADIALETTAYILDKAGLNGTTVYQMTSLFDDVLAEFPPQDKSVRDFIARLNYSSGGTLRLVPAFFKGYGIDGKGLQDAYRQITKLYPGAVEGGRDIQEALGIDIHYLTTTWENGAAGFVEPLGVPPERVHASPLDIDRYKLNAAEIQVIKSGVKKLHDFTLEIKDKGKELQIDKSVKSFDDFEPFIQERFWKMKKIIIDDFGAIPEIMRLYEEVRIVDAGKKAEIFKREMERAAAMFPQAVAIGDSSTDRKTLVQVRDNGGVAIAHNAKPEAIDNANFALGTKNYYITAPILGIADKGGMDALIGLADGWSYDLLMRNIEKHKLPEIVADRTKGIFGNGRTEFPRFVYLPHLNQQEREEFAKWSKQLRYELRGAEIAIIR